ncbi:MAG: ATP-dependent acyl-CoA ligase [Alphaproteobacteria bacterium]|nr:ATP-dependent acyl-CoA ligase [Alphaproteobacteria bacterium]
MQRLVDLFEAAVGRNPKGPFICIPPLAGRSYLPEGAEWSYAEIATRVDEIERLYRAAGYGHGHRVAALLENRPEMLLHFFALNRLGAVLVPLNPYYRTDELSYVIDHSEADLAVSVPERLAELTEVCRALPRPIPVFDVYALAGRLPGPRGPALPGAPEQTSEAALLYTSGTTGRPKGCRLPNEYFLNSERWYAKASGHMRLDDRRDRAINPLPLFHANALAISTPGMLAVAGCVIVPDRFHASRWWRDCIECRATLCHYLGIMPPALLNLPPSPQERQHRMRFALGGGIDPEQHAAAEERFGMPFIELWGMTECGVPCFAGEEPRKVGTRAFGRIVPDMEARIVDDNEQPVPFGAPGELQIRRRGAEPRRGFFLDYLKNPEATEEAWQGGWFHTGDACTQDADGVLHFVDRKKNIVRRSGENIAAAEVEGVLQASPDVAQAAVLAVKDEFRQEEVMACIVPKAGIARERATAERIFQWCSERLAYYKAPGWILFLDRLPTTSTQKVQKHEILGRDVDPRTLPGALDFRPGKKDRR